MTEVMEKQVGLAMRTAFISDKILQHLATDFQGDPDSIELASLLSSDPLTAVVHAYCKSMGNASYDKTNLFAFKRLLTEGGIQLAVSADAIRAICPEGLEGGSTEDTENELKSYAMTCEDPYERISQNIALLHGDFNRIEKLLIIQKERLTLEAAKATVMQHATALTRKRRQLVIYDDYGSLDKKRWYEEVKYFINMVLLPSLEGETLSGSSIETIFAYIEEVATQSKPPSEDQSLTKQTVDPSPRDFEHYCSTILQGQGWNARLTKLTGDQGIDIVAERNGLTLVFQCKQYNGSVGNKAVQEAHAGKGFLNADLAVVVSNASFTTSAKELAASLNVLLLHDTQLHELDRVLFLDAQRRR